MVHYITPNKQKKYDTYNNMYQRCYCAAVHFYKPNYRGCSICDEWLNDPQSFYEWMDSNFYEILLPGEPSVELDHDILVKGNKVYSPDTCLFVPKSINSAFAGSYSTKRDGLPMGVKRLRSGKYKPMIPGFTEAFDTIIEAWLPYKDYREMKIQELINNYIGHIPDRVIDAVLAYPIEITDGLPIDYKYCFDF